MAQTRQKASASKKKSKTLSGSDHHGAAPSQTPDEEDDDVTKTSSRDEKHSLSAASDLRPATVSSVCTPEAARSAESTVITPESPGDAGRGGVQPISSSGKDQVREDDEAEDLPTDQTSRDGGASKASSVKNRRGEDTSPDSHTTLGSVGKADESSSSPSSSCCNDSASLSMRESDAKSPASASSEKEALRTTSGGKEEKGGGEEETAVGPRPGDAETGGRRSSWETSSSPVLMSKNDARDCTERKDAENSKDSMAFEEKNKKDDTCCSRTEEEEEEKSLEQAEQEKKEMSGEVSLCTAMKTQAHSGGEGGEAKEGAGGLLSPKKAERRVGGGLSKKGQNISEQRKNGNEKKHLPNENIGENSFFGAVNPVKPSVCTPRPPQQPSDHPPPRPPFLIAGPPPLLSHPPPPPPHPPVCLPPPTPPCSPLAPASFVSSPPSSSYPSSHHPHTSMLRGPIASPPPPPAYSPQASHQPSSPSPVSSPPCTTSFFYPSPRPRPPSPFVHTPQHTLSSPPSPPPQIERKKLEGCMDPLTQLAYFTLLQKQQSRLQQEQGEGGPEGQGDTHVTSSFSSSASSLPSISSSYRALVGKHVSQNSPSSDTQSYYGDGANRTVVGGGDGGGGGGGGGAGSSSGSVWSVYTAGGAGGAYSEPEMLKRIEAARTYEETRSLVNLYSKKADKHPEVLGGLILKVAMKGREAFKEQLIETRRQILAKHAGGGSEQEREKELLKNPAPGSTLGKIASSNLREDAKFDDFCKTIKRLADQLFARLKSHPLSVSNVSLQNLIWGMSLTSLNCMEMFRELAVEISKRESFSSSQLVTIYCSYTRGLEATSTDRKGGINITTDDSKFIQFLVEKLLAHPEELVALTCKQIAFFLQACNRLNYDNEELLHHIGKTVLAKEKEFQPKEWSMIVAVYTRFGVPLRGDCRKLRRSRQQRDWERPPPPKKPKPISQC